MMSPESVRRAAAPGSEVSRPLLSWDRFVLRLDLDILQTVLNQHLSERSLPVTRAEVSGRGDELDARVELSWKGLPAHVSVRLAEVRVKRRFLGCRIVAVHGPLGIPVPLPLLRPMLARFGPGFVHFDASDGILIADLREHVPSGIDLQVSGVRCRGRQLELELAPGSWTPTTSDVLLPASTL